MEQNQQTTRLHAPWCLLLTVIAASSVQAGEMSRSLDCLFGECTNWVSPGDSFHPKCCDQLFAPPMIGDSLGVPIAIGNANRQVLHTQHFSKVADHNSPIPRTRVFMSYQRFDSYNAVESQNNAADNQIDLHVYKLGFEKTLFDGNASVDFILPMYQTLSPVNNGVGAPATDELGNITFGYKHVLYEQEGLLISAGLRAEAPTEDNIVSGGAQINLDEWYMQPWVGFIVQGDDDTFLHCFISERIAGSDFDSIFQVIDEGFAVGSTESQHLFMVDVGVGKWIHLSRECSVRAIVPTLELHYMHASGADTPFGLNGNLFGANVDVLNLTLGATAYVGERSAVQVGFGIPLQSNNDSNLLGANGTVDSDSFYDWELLVHWTIFRR